MSNDSNPSDFNSAGCDETLDPSRSPTDHTKTQSDTTTREFGDYQLVEEIARGGMGVVYRGRQKSLDRDVAIKMILAGQFASQEEVDRFYTEATAAGKLDHPNIVPVYEVGEFDGHHFFSMKLIEGTDLGGRLGELRNDLPVAVGILRKVCDAVHHAHQRGILHRDLKPGNILLDENDEPYVTDLGLARRFNDDSRLTQTGAVIGTPSYMPPEQAAGNSDITTSADIYSLGAILYEILSGRPPFKASTPVETLMQVINEMPERPTSIGAKDRALESICMKCLAKEPNDRYASAADLSADLNRWLNGEPISVRSTTIANATKYWLKQNFGSAIWSIVIGPVMGVISGLCLWYSTIGLNTSEVLNSYSKLPSAVMPSSAWLGAVPSWAQVPLLILFLMSIVFIGYVTARFVNPKHRGADLAAGSIVGLTASLAAFMIALGPICILTVLEYHDVRSVNQIANVEDGGTPSWILDAYPELATMKRSEQMLALSNKMEAEHFLKVPQGLWLGAIVALAIYFLPCLYETSVAGPILRKKEPWYRALPAYLEVTFPAVTFMTVVAMAGMTWLVFGGVGFRWTSRMAILLLLIFLSLFAARMKWKLLLRLAVQACFMLAFVWFFATDFPSIPGVADCNAKVARADRAVRELPRSSKAHVNLVSVHLTYAEMLQRSARNAESIDLLDVAIAKADAVAEQAEAGMLDEFDDAAIRQLQCVCRLRRTDLLVQTGDLNSAEAELERIRKQFPGVQDISRLEDLIQQSRDAGK